jgi:hypothetical protein
LNFCPWYSERKNNQSIQNIFQKMLFFAASPVRWVGGVLQSIQYSFKKGLSFWLSHCLVIERIIQSIQYIFKNIAIFSLSRGYK